MFFFISFIFIWVIYLLFFRVPQKQKRVYFKKDKKSIYTFRKYLAITKNKRLKMHEKNFLSLVTGIPVNVIYNWIRNERSRQIKKEKANGIEPGNI